MVLAPCDLQGDITAEPDSAETPVHSKNKRFFDTLYKHWNKVFG